MQTLQNRGGRGRGHRPAGGGIAEAIGTCRWDRARRGGDDDGPLAGPQRDAATTTALGGRPCLGFGGSLAGDPVGAETVKAALGTGKVRSVMESAAPSAACSMLARAFDTLLYMECFEEADELFAVAWEVAERQGAFTTMSMLAVIGAAGFWWRGRLRAALTAGQLGGDVVRVGGSATPFQTRSCGP